MPASRIVVAAKVLVYVNGVLFGQCTSFAWNSATPHKKIRTVDIQFPVELASATSEINWTMGVLRTIGDGGLQGAGIIAPQNLLSKEKYFTLLLVERTSSLQLFRADMAVADAENWQINAKGKMEGTASGSAVIWTNESANK
jgi:hypothetical protein